jgi:hypothetical protein
MISVIPGDGQVLGTSSFKASDISQQLAPFLKPREPIVIEHEIK